MANGVGKRGANYSPAPKSVGWSTFSIEQRGYSFTFSQNFPEWKQLTVLLKDKMREELRNAIGIAMQSIAQEAIKRCPHYSGSLERSIKVVVPQATGFSGNARIEASVGVLSSWKSTAYDEFLDRIGMVDAPRSGPMLVRYMHEYYDDFVTAESTPNAWKRKTRKEAANGGVKVGSYFLTRAWRENEGIVRSDAIDTLKKGIAGMRTYWTPSKPIKQEDINRRLDAYAASFSEITDGDSDGE